MSKKQETELVETGSTAVSTVAQDLNAWGDSNVSSRDMVMSKILVMQGLSELVTENKARFGDYVDSVTHEVLGSIDKPLEIIPFHMDKTWLISSREKGEEKYKFERYEAINASNENKYPFSEIVGSTEFKYEYTYQFYVILPTDPSMPKVISMKGSSSKSGKALATQMYVRNKFAGLVPPAYTMELGGKKEKNEKGTFAVMETKPKYKTSDEDIRLCLDWMKVIQAGKARVAESAVAEEANYATDETAKF